MFLIHIKYHFPVSVMSNIKKKKIRLSELHDLKKVLRDSNLHTVCEEAKCPNISECFSKKTATFMIMGDVCTRNCAFCNVKFGIPQALDKDEPKRIAQTAKDMGLSHVVITSVTRDDLLDGGARHFAETVAEVKRTLSNPTIEVLTPDFKGNKESLDIVFASSPNVFNHNIETIKALSKKIRPQADYNRSLDVLSYASSKGMLVKSGFMLGLGEEIKDVYVTIKDLLANGVKILTIGQYFNPKKLDVVKYYTVGEFDELAEYAKNLGFDYVFSGVYVRSSYMASEVFNKK